MKHFKVGKYPLKRSAVTVAVLLTFVSAVPSAHAHGEAPGIIATMTQFITKWVTGTMQGFINQGFGAVDSSIQKSVASVQAEINKQGAIAGNTALAVADAEQIANFRRDAAAVDAATELPKSTCTTVGMGAGLSNADGIRKANIESAAAAAASGRVSYATNSNYNTSTRLAGNFVEASTRYCTDVDMERGRCAGGKGRSTNVKPHLQGADTSPRLLFGGGPDGAEAWATRAQPEGAEYKENERAIDDYVSRIVAQTPPEVLRDPKWEKTRDGMAYVELTRRYDALMALSRHTLFQIKEDNRPVPGFADSALFRENGLVKPGQDISMVGAIAAYVKSKFTPAAIADLAQSSDSSKLLREIAMTNAFNLKLNEIQMNQGARTEALLAAQLALLTEQVLRPQITAQMNAVHRKAGQ